jgi:hypothetical protein
VERTGGHEYLTDEAADKATFPSLPRLPSGL